MHNILSSNFFQDDAQQVAKKLLGKVIYKRHEHLWLCAMIIETEAYYRAEKGSHSSLGFTEKRKALFMPAGTIYMYYARGGDSLNISCEGEGNAVLIKSGIPYSAAENYSEIVSVMQMQNPMGAQKKLRQPEYLCSGQTLLCKSLGLKVPEWNQKNFDPNIFYMADVGYAPKNIIQTKRLGIPVGRDEHLEYRFVDEAFRKFCTLRK